MAITVEFNVPAMTGEQYDTVMKQLAERSLDHPQGRAYHVAGPNEGGWFVLDVWESEAALNEFAQTLMPILGSVGVEPPTPLVRPVHNIVAPS